MDEPNCDANGSRPNERLKGDGTGTKLDDGDTRREVDAMDGLTRGWSDIEGKYGCANPLQWHRTIADVMETISKHGDAAKLFS